ncbi:ras-like GTP-binding protein rhoA isoform X2 [Trachemys scripta elegans]|uniref:ras-like GTP-binding protein rhoA isoform X2 n=1 Tax=Trachemys scripta elegans TaxID=31138 RepID=UPI0015569234|nr:ras-like GTP-binding protein rhoA isoform X2 [Trachemys scripta elegans]
MAAVWKKLTVVGDVACGKTCLLLAFCKEQFPKCYEPTVFETYIKDTEVDGKSMKLMLFDVAGQRQAPIVLVATKKELRNDEGVLERLATLEQEPIKTEEGKALAASIGAYAYLECSAKTKDGIERVLQIIGQAAIRDGTKKRRKHHVFFRLFTCGQKQ